MVSNEEIISACQSSLSMSEACAKVKLHFNTFKKRAIQLGIYKPNMSGKGMSKAGNGTKIPLDEILNGQHPYYQTNKLRVRLLKEGVKEHKCEKCNNTEWLGFPIPLELNHKDGNKNNHLWKNLEMLCPNCHAQTSTYRGKNIRPSGVSSRAEGW